MASATQTYTVSGYWPFPEDMLRHDGATVAPESAEVVALLTPCEEYGSVKDGADMTRRYRVNLVREVSHRWPRPNFCRWRSFSWEVDPSSLPEHLI